MSNLVAQQPNRSARRQVHREQSRKERSQEKRFMKNAPDSVRFNSKKSRKIVPFNPTLKNALIDPTIKNALLEKDDDTTTVIITRPEKIDSTEMPVVTDECHHQGTVSEVISYGQDENKEPEQKEEEEEQGVTSKQLEPPSTQEEVACKEISDPSATNEEEYNASNLVAASSIKDRLLKINQDDSIDVLLINPDDSHESIDKKAQSTTTVTLDKPILNDTNKESKEKIKKKRQQEQEEEEVQVKKEATPAPSVTTSSISDKISPSTSTSSNVKRRSNLISRLFKHKNSSKKKIHSIQESCLENETVPTEKKNKSKAWKIWKKL